MSYYIYAIHTDSSFNRLCDIFNDFKEAENREKEMRAGNYPGDNYFVTMFYAKDDSDVKEKLIQFRKERNLLF